MQVLNRFLIVRPTRSCCGELTKDDRIYRKAGTWTLKSTLNFVVMRCVLKLRTRYPLIVPSGVSPYPARNPQEEAELSLTYET